MKKTMLVLIALVSVVLMVSCTSVSSPKVPDTYEFNPGLHFGRQYEILGDFELEAQITNRGWYGSSGGMTFSDFLEGAQKAYPTADAIINIYEDSVNQSNQYITLYYIGTMIEYI